MGQTKKKNANGAQKKSAQNSSYASIIKRFNDLAQTYSSVMASDAFYGIFARAGQAFANQPQIQNRRIKSISSLPVDFTKEEIGEMLRNPYSSEQPLRQTSDILRYTAYPYFKIGKTYQDIPTYRHYSKPLYISKEDAKSKDFLREAVLIDKLTKTLAPEKCAHKIAGQIVNQGKVFYTLRTSVDKVHNQINYAFMQQLPEDWCYIIGFNNVSGYTVSFNMMYFLQPGTDYTQFGDLFTPYMYDFEQIFKPKEQSKYVYASKRPTIKTDNRGIEIYPENRNPNGYGNPNVFMQNGTWMYYVTLPIDKVWVYELDDTTGAVVPPLAGLMLTYAQQSDYEAAQLSLLLNPLIKIFTGEIPYFENNGATTEDGYMLSLGGRALFENYFNTLMAQNNTGGTAFFSAPVKNIKSHDYAESANANEISESFNRYGMEKAGLSSIIPVAEDVKAAQVEASTKIESRYVTATLYPQFCRMMNNLYRSLNLKHEWAFNMFGTIFDEERIRDNALKSIANGDLSAHFTLSALDGCSWLDKLSMMSTIKESGMLDMLIPPVTAYTMKQENSNLPPRADDDEGGRPVSEEMTEAKEKYIDAYGE